MSDHDPRNDGAAWLERLSFVRRVLSNSRYELTLEDREELAQEALTDLFIRSRSERPQNWEGLLRTIAHRKAVDLFRARTRWRRVFDSCDPSGLDAPDPAAGPRAELRARVAESLPGIAEAWFRNHKPDCLPHARTYFEDGAWKSLAAEKDARVNTVIQQWTRCRDALVAHLRTCGMGWVLGDE